MNLRIARSRIKDPVTKRTQKYEFPTRGEIAVQTGYPDIFLPRASLLMYATSFGLRNYSGEHQPTHYNDSATTANARYPKSGFMLSPAEMAQEYQHDVPEDVSKDMAKRYAKAQPHKHRPTAAYVLIDVIDNLLREDLNADVRRMLDLRTNFGKMIFDPVEDHYESAAKQRPGQRLIVTPGELSDMLKAAYDGFTVSPETIKRFYNDIIRKWEYVASVAKGAVSYLPNDEVEYLLDTLDTFSEETKKRLRAGDIEQATGIERLVRQSHDEVQAIIGSDKLETVDPKLLLVTQVEMVERVKKLFIGII